MPAPLHTPIATLNRDNFAPIFLQNIANKISRGASREYLRLFGIGIIECRILAVLAGQPDITANEICTLIDVDKAAVSRSLRVLEGRSYVHMSGRGQDRRRVICLTESGAALHNQILVIGKAREQELLEGFSGDEHSLMMDFLKRLLANAVVMNEKQYEAGTGHPRRSGARGGNHISKTNSEKLGVT